MMRLFLVTALALAGVRGAEVRDWTDVDGRTITAELVRVEDGKAVLSMRGREYPVPLERLSEADREFIAKLSAPPPDADQVTIGEVTAKAGGDQVIFTLPLPLEIREEAAKTERPSKELKVGLQLPEGFDRTKPQKFLWVWTPVNSPRDLERGNIPTMRAFSRDALPLGWAVFAVDTELGYPNDGSFPEIVLQGLKVLGEAIPGFKDSMFATGGFSGGAKAATIGSGAVIEAELDLRGIFMSGCNQSRLPTAQDIFKASRGDYREVKAYLSNGTMDNTAPPEKAERVIDELDSAGLDEAKLVTFEGGHNFHKPHIGEALKWFEEAPE